MGRTARDVEAYLEAVGRPYESVDDGTFLIQPSGEGMPPIAVRADDPVVFTVDIGPISTADPSRLGGLFKRLLEFNANDLLFCAYGIREERIILSAALPLENLDLNEIQAVVADIELAVLMQVPQLMDLARPPSSSRKRPSVRPNA